MKQLVCEVPGKPEKAAQVVIKDRERSGSVTDTIFKDLKTPIQKINIWF